MKNAFNSLIDELKHNLKTCPNFKSQIPNILTASRAIAPLIVIPLILSGNLILALGLGTLFASTDFVDGYLARKYNNVSKFGEHLDQVCDKIFAISFLVTSAFLNPIMVLNIVPEIAIALINVRALEKKNKPKTSLLGKFKTALLSLNILTSLIPNIHHFNLLLTITTFLVQSITAIDYQYSYQKNEKEKLTNGDIKNNSNEMKEQNKTLTNKKSLSRKRQMIELLEYKKELLKPEEAKIKKLTYNQKKVNKN